MHRWRDDEDNDTPGPGALPDNADRSARGRQFHRERSIDSAHVHHVARSLAHSKYHVRVSTFQSSSAIHSGQPVRCSLC
jgi:hypothetical protein